MLHICCHHFDVPLLFCNLLRFDVRSNISQPGLADFQHKCRDSHHLSSSHKGRGAHSDTAGHAGSWGALNIFNHLYSFCFCTCPTCTPSFIGFTVCQPPKPECTWTSSFIVLDWVDFELGITWYNLALDDFGWFWCIWHVSEDSADKFHDYDGLAGKMLLAKLASWYKEHPKTSWMPDTSRYIQIPLYMRRWQSVT